MLCARRRVCVLFQGLQIHRQKLKRGFPGECSVGGWTDVVAVSAGMYHTLGLRSDGTLVAAESNGNGQCVVDG